jgi:hypothetical protein
MQKLPPSDRRMLDLDQEGIFPISQVSLKLLFSINLFLLGLIFLETPEYFSTTEDISAGIFSFGRRLSLLLFGAFFLSLVLQLLWKKTVSAPLALWGRTNTWMRTTWRKRWWAELGFSLLRIGIYLFFIKSLFSAFFDPTFLGRYGRNIVQFSEQLQIFTNFLSFQVLFPLVLLILFLLSCSLFLDRILFLSEFGMTEKEIESELEETEMKPEIRNRLRNQI